MAFDFAPDRTGPPPVGKRRPSLFGERIPEMGLRDWATIVDRDWASNSATSLTESFVNLDQAVTQILCEGETDVTYLLYFFGHGSPKIDLAPLTSGLPAEDLPPTLSLCLRVVHERQSVLTEAQAAALNRQLRVLLEDEGELRDANISVSVLSLHRLINFLSEHQTSPLPSLSITRLGFFAASWSPRKRAKLTVVFQPEGEADWIASDLNATPPLHQKDTLANRLGEFAAWANA